MKNSIANRFAFLFTLIAVIAVVPVSQAGTLTWASLSTVTNLWSEANNWSPANLPTAGDTVVFTNAGSTNVLGAVNNALNASLTISNLFYNQISNNVGVNFHTTLINTGATLSVNSTVSGSNAPIVLVGGDVGGANDQVYTSVTGEGTLAIGSLGSPDTNNDLVVSARALTANSGGHKGTLDMSGLNRFTFGGGRFHVAANGVSAALAGAQYAGQDRPLGSVLLAKTNIITCARPRADQFPFAVAPFAFLVNRYANSANLASLLELGQENTINAEAITVAGARGGNGAATMKFRTGLTSPTLKLRGADGVSRVSEIGIGDNNIPNGATVQSIGILDLSLGTVDALVDTIIVGRNNGYNNTQAANGTGTLTLGPGTCDVTTLNIGCQGVNNASRATGTVNVRTGAILIAGNINIGRDAGDGSSFGTGTLAIPGGTAKVSGNILENDGPGGVNGVSTLTLSSSGTLDMMPTGDTTPGDITVDKLNFGVCTLTNYGTLSLATLAITAPATDFTLYSGQALAPIAPGSVGTLAVTGGNLILDSGTLRFDLNSPGASDVINVAGTLTLNGLNTLDASAGGGTIAPGTYTLMTSSSLVGNASNLQVSGALSNSRYTFGFDTSSGLNVDLTVSGAISNLIWSGDGAANLWNLKSAANWNSQTEQFYDLDTITFDDSSANHAVTLAGSLLPTSVTINSAANYTFSGTGEISGTGGLENDGNGTLTISTANDYTGATTINAGTVLVNGALGLTTVTVNSGGTLGGTGTILGPVSVPGGTLSPGDSIGTLAISNTLTLNGTAVFEVNMDSLAQDKVVGLTSVAYGGTLSLVFSGRPVASTDSFKLFYPTTDANPILNYSPYSGAFANILPATPGTDMAWNTSTLTSDGTLRITSTASPNVASLVAGNQLTLSWPPDHVGWRLQVQTNAPSVGLSTAWFDVPNTSSRSNYTATISPANGSVFYRLTYP